MIEYSSSSPRDFARWTGSVAPKAARWAVPSAMFAILYYRLIHDWTEGWNWLNEPTPAEMTAFSLFTSILGFLIVFRAQLSYARYWEGITLAERACGVWLNGCSNLIAFCNTAPDKQEEVETFQYMLSRLMSLTVCFAMSDISNLERSTFEHLDLDCLDPAGIGYLQSTSAKHYVSLQWIQRLVVENSRTGVVDISAPVLSRVFQEFSIGIVHFIDAKKLQAVPFPFEFAQMVWLMLVFFSLIPVPLICAVGMDELKAALYTFMIVFVFWSVHHIAVEIEMPFGEDPNDLPLDKINRKFNKVLLRLLETKAQQMPTLVRRPAVSVRSEMIQSTLIDTAHGGAPCCGPLGVCLAFLFRHLCPGMAAERAAAQKAARVQRAATRRAASLRQELRSDTAASSLGTDDDSSVTRRPPDAIRNHSPSASFSPREVEFQEASQQDVIIQSDCVSSSSPMPDMWQEAPCTEEPPVAKARTLHFAGAWRSEQSKGSGGARELAWFSESSSPRGPPHQRWRSMPAPQNVRPNEPLRPATLPSEPCMAEATQRSLASTSPPLPRLAKVEPDTAKPRPEAPPPCSSPCLLLTSVRNAQPPTP
mmetsp:Transcript_116107/g.335322  ORF Transcript_116107/g.335322 Transcript_116107/m.335322 type:complete len:591 (+) Transcript_116107:118-1890(+)